MKRVLLLCFTFVFSLCLLGGNQAGAEPNDPPNKDDAPKVELTDKQKAELDTLYSELFTKKKAVIDKYVEFGVFSKEVGDKKKAWMDERYSKLKENGYIPSHCPHKHKMKNMQPQE
jgi:hypothetical protein